MAVGEGKKNIGALVGLVGVGCVLDQNVAAGSLLVGTKVVELVGGLFPEADQNVPFARPVAEDAMPVGFFRILLVETDHEGLGVGEVVGAEGGR